MKSYGNVDGNQIIAENIHTQTFGAEQKLSSTKFVFTNFRGGKIDCPNSPCCSPVTCTIKGIFTKFLYKMIIRNGSDNGKLLQKIVLPTLLQLSAKILPTAESSTPFIYDIVMHYATYLQFASRCRFSRTSLVNKDNPVCFWIEECSVCWFCTPPWTSVSDLIKPLHKQMEN